MLYYQITATEKLLDVEYKAKLGELQLQLSHFEAER